MHELAASYLRVKPSVVAIARRVHQNPLFPEIIRTGFIADASGIVVTNQHVVAVVRELQNPAGESGIARAVIASETDSADSSARLTRWRRSRDSRPS